VFVSDFGKIKDKYKQVLTNYGIDWRMKKHTEALILKCDVVMKSPGIPEKLQSSRSCGRKGIQSQKLSLQRRLQMRLQLELRAVMVKQLPC
jgi:UDP-N-acetylmuramoylalanine-D-glutamate ligase